MQNSLWFFDMENGNPFFNFSLTAAAQLPAGDIFKE